MYNIDDIPAKEFFPGFEGKLIHTDSMTLAYWDIAEGCDLPEHSHVHEQVVNVLEGSFELTVDGKTHVLNKGAVFPISSNAVHSGKALTFCKILDVFNPVREDYR